jgi:hypothetical protein
MLLSLRADQSHSYPRSSYSFGLAVGQPRESVAGVNEAAPRRNVSADSDDRLCHGSSSWGSRDCRTDRHFAGGKWRAFAQPVVGAPNGRIDGAHARPTVTAVAALVSGRFTLEPCALARRSWAARRAREPQGGVRRPRDHTDLRRGLHPVEAAHAMGHGSRIPFGSFARTARERGRG